MVVLPPAGRPQLLYQHGHARVPALLDETLRPREIHRPGARPGLPPADHPVETSLGWHALAVIEPQVVGFQTASLHSMAVLLTAAP